MSVGRDVFVCECRTVAEAAEQIEEWIIDDHPDREAPEPGDPDPATLRASYGIKFNEHHAWSLIHALTTARRETAKR